MLPHSTKLVSGSKDGTVKYWETASTLHKRDPVLPVNPVTWRFAKDGKSVITIEEGGRIARWKGTGFKERQNWLDAGMDIYGASISEENRLAALTATNGMVQLWDLPRRVMVREFDIRSAPVRPLRFLAKDTRLILLNDRDETLHECDLTTFQQTRAWKIPHGVTWRDARWAVFSNDERWSLAIGYRGSCLLKDLVTGQETIPNLQISQTGGCAFSPDGTRFAAVSHLGYLKIWETTTVNEVATLRGFMLGIHCVAFSPNGKRLAAGSNGREAIKLFDTTGHHELVTLEGEGSVFSTAEFSPDGNAIGAINSQGVLHVWQAPSWSEIEAQDKLEGRGSGWEGDVPQTKSIYE